MVRSRKVLHSTILLTLGQVLSYGMSFARNVILARILTKADFGLAALFGTTMILLEVAGRMAIGQQIVQSRNGDSEEYQSTSHAFQAVLASIGAVLIAAASYPMAHVMKVPNLWWAFATLAIVPLARAFEHLDYYRKQRSLEYLPGVLCDLVPQIAITAAAWPLALWLGDFRVIIWLMIAKSVIGMAMTHILADRPYRWAWNKAYIIGMCSFGLPLFLNGLLIFGSQQADQVVVGAFLTLEKLASYALAFSLVSIPGSIFAQVGSSLLLPLFSKAQDDSEGFRERYRICSQYASMAAVLLILPLIVVGEQMATFVYGPKYSNTGVLLAVLGAAAAIRFLRIVPAIASMAKADTVNQLYSNVFRCLSLPLAVVAAKLGGGVVAIASCALVAELLAAATSIVRLKWRQGVPISETVGAAIYLLGFVGLGIALNILGSPSWSRLTAILAIAVMIPLSALVGKLAFPFAFHEILALRGSKKQ